MALTQITTDGIKDGTITGTDLTTNVDLVDNQKLRLGTSNDLQIYHSGSASIIQDTGDGNIKIISNKLEILNAANNEYMAVGNQDGNFELYFNGSKKFETVTGGATITGVCTATSFAGDGSSLSGINTDLVSDTSPQLGGNLASNGSDIIFADNDKALFGSGSDLEIFHDGGNSFIRNATNDFVIQNASGNSNNQIRIRAEHAEESIVANGNGSVDLYHNNSKKFETASYGAVTTGTFQATGNIEVFDNGKFIAGTGADLQIYHDGTNSTILNQTGDLRIRNAGPLYITKSSTENMGIFVPDGKVELYFDNSKKFETRSDGVSFSGDTFMPDNEYAHFGTGNDMYIGHDGNTSWIKNSATDLVINTTNFYVNNSAQTETMISANQNGAVNLKYDNNTKLSTDPNGAILKGSSSYSNFFLKNSGNQECGYVQGWSNGTSQEIGFARSTDGGWFIRCDKNTSSGIQVEYHWQDIRPASNNNYDLGSTSLRWRNIYTNDLNLSNEGSSNDVDGTWGNWTIQEGESDLFLKNNRSGKKYKFNLTEVS